MILERQSNGGDKEPRPDAHTAQVGGHSFIARIPSGQQYWAIPSIHGDVARLRAMHDRLEERFLPGTDRLVYLGNYLGYGEAITETLDEMLRFRFALTMKPGVEPWDIVYLRGAQEEMWWKLLKLQMATDPGDALRWMMAHGVDATLIAYGGSPEEGLRRCREGVMPITKWTGQLRRTMQERPGHFELLTSLWRAATTGEGGLLFVHASVDPSRPLSMQGDIFWWDTGTFERIDRPFQGFVKVIRGYDHRHKGPNLEHPHSVTLDAACGFSGSLIAGCFNNSGDLVDLIRGDD